MIDQTVLAISQSPNILDHSGRLPALVNAWTALYKIEIEAKDIKELKQEVEELKKMVIIRDY